MIRRGTGLDASPSNFRVLPSVLVPIGWYIGSRSAREGASLMRAEARMVCSRGPGRPDRDASGRRVVT